MNSGEAVIFLICLVFAGIILGEHQSATKTEVYMCSEITKDTPADVKQICKKAGKYGD